MLTITCSEKQRDTQLTRHTANALMSALRRGPRFERPGTPWRVSAKAPNAPVNLPYSPLLDDLRSNLRRVQALELNERLEREQQLKLTNLLAQREVLVGEIREASGLKEAQWPYVAGLYAVRVPEVRLLMGEAVEVCPPRSLFRALDVHDGDPIWPALAHLLRTSRGEDAAAPFYLLKRVDAGQRDYQRTPHFPKSVAAWLVERVGELALLEVSVSAGDYEGVREKPVRLSAS